MKIGKKEKLLIGIGVILFVKIFDWSNYYLLLGFLFIILALSNKEEQSEESDNNSN